jgi:uncharacterized SAM-binding protein YcdF (DUF218 family)
MRTPNRHTLRVAIVLLLALLAVDLVICQQFNRRIDAGVAPLILNAAAATTARVAVVFFHSMNKQGVLAPGQISRLETTRQLYQRGSVAHILCVGGARPQQGLFGSVISKEWLVSHGVPASRVYADTASFDTRSNLAIAARELAVRPGQTVVLVATPAHLYRILQWMPMTNVPVACAPAPYGGFFPWWDAVNHELLALTARRLLSERAYAALIGIVRHRRAGVEGAGAAGY